MDTNLEVLQKGHLLVAGEIGIDEYLWGTVSRISPEAPVPVVEVESRTTQLGLTANVAQNIVSLGARVTLVSIRGEDQDGELLSGMIQKAGVQSSTLISDPTRPTLRKVRVIAQRQHVVRVDYESSAPLDIKTSERFTQTLCDLIPSCDGIILQDYGKGIWKPDTMAFLDRAKELKKPVFVDPSRVSSLELYRGTTLLTPNRMEAQLLTGTPSREEKSEDTLYKMAKTILEKTRAEHTIITCGSEGMVALSKDQNTLLKIPTFAREVFDVTGAGDTVIAVLSLCSLAGFPLSRCMEIANAAAGLVVARVGTASITMEELVQEWVRLQNAGLIHP
jgi:rfaE bifunctional protein kinase chain/domain